jgi:hypothetical protein
MSIGQLDPAEVQVGTANGPGIWLAPAGTPGPPDTIADWPAPWSCLGYLSDDGPTVGQSTDSTDITPWQSVVPIRTVITSRGVTLQFTMWQLNAETLALYFDTDMPVEGADGELEMDIRTDSPQHIYAVGIDTRDADRVLRIIFPRATLSDAGDMQIQRGAAIPLDVTLSALDDGGHLARILLGPAVEDDTQHFQTDADFIKATEAVAANQQRDMAGSYANQKAAADQANAEAQRAAAASRRQGERAAEQHRRGGE